MRKSIFVFLFFVPYPAVAQISSGTSIILNSTKDEIVVAADSRTQPDNGGPPDDSYCKISTFRYQFVFTSVGKAKSINPSDPSDPINNWDNAAVARDALQNATKGMTVDDAYMDAVIDYWAKIITGHWNVFCGLNRQKCAGSTEPITLGAQVNQLTGGVFIGAKGLFIRAAIISFDNDMQKMLSPVNYSKLTALPQCWPCGRGEQICAAGSHMDVAAQFCSERKPNTKLSIRTALVRADQHAKLAVQIVEKTIDAYEKSAKDVGGAVDAVTITKNGKIIWNARKRNCPENQN